VITCRFTAPRHSFVLRYCNALQLIGIHQALPFRTPFLMEVAGGKLFLVPHVAPVGHSLLFAVGAWPPQDGVRRTRCLNLSRDLEALLPAGSGLSTRSPRPSSPQERRGSALVRRKLELLLRRRSCGLLAPTELAAIDPHAVQDDRQLAGDRNASARHAAPLRYLHAPGPQRGPFRAADQQRVGRFVECRARQLVAIG
jgi:hypothetical protein